MPNLNVPLSDFDYQQFKLAVGDRNMSSTIRNFVKTYTGGKDSDKEYIIMKRLEKAKEEKEKVDKEFNKWKAKADIIETKRKEEEEKKLKWIEEQKKRQKDAKYRAVKANMHWVIK